MSSAPSVVVVLVVLVGCSEPPRSDAGFDAGRDAGHDAGRDAATDAAPEAGMVDGGNDAALPDPAWAFVEGLPDGCHFEVALRPTGALPPLRFEPCPGRSGCRRAIVDWPYSPESGARLGLHDPSARDETHTYFTWVRSSEASGRWWWNYIVSRDDGIPMLVLRKRMVSEVEGGCTMTQLAITPESFATAVITVGGEFERQSFPVRARFDEVEAWAAATDRAAIEDFIQEVHTSDTTTVLEGRGRTYRYGPDRTVEQLDLSDPAAVNAVVGDETFASLFANPEGWRGVRFRADQTTPETFIAATAEAEAATLRFDGDQVSWFRLIDPITVTRYSRSELWVSALDDDHQPVAPRMLSRLIVPTFHGATGHGFGRVWVGEDIDQVGIFDTTTAERREYRSPAERAVRYHPILGPEEVGFGVAYLDTTRGLETIEFVRYDSLPVVPVPE